MQCVQGVRYLTPDGVGKQTSEIQNPKLVGKKQKFTGNEVARLERAEFKGILKGIIELK